MFNANGSWCWIPSLPETRAPRHQTRERPYLLQAAIESRPQNSRFWTQQTNHRARIVLYEQRVHGHFALHGTGIAPTDEQRRIRDRATSIKRQRCLRIGLRLFHLPQQRNAPVRLRLSNGQQDRRRKFRFEQSGDFSIKIINFGDFNEI